MEKEILSLVELSVFTGLSKDNLRKKVRMNEIPYVRVGRRLLFRHSAIMAWLVKQESNSV